jgi:hypothetical protein
MPPVQSVRQISIRRSGSAGCPGCPPESSAVRLVREKAVRDRCPLVELVAALPLLQSISVTAEGAIEGRVEVEYRPATVDPRTDDTRALDQNPGGLQAKVEGRLTSIRLERQDLRD